ncbi:hypothetical protein [Neptuniibacter sp. QD37_11]|uniref:hypothetical protein n=1 Tax=Neptuniibacter sp. QD37_11 TaxID=3398209 RepID=UPI0039F45792
MSASDKILSVEHVHADGWGFSVECPHCHAIMTIQGQGIEDIQGEQYQHYLNGCGGWIEVSNTATLDIELKEPA